MADAAVDIFRGTTIAFGTTTPLNSLQLIDLAWNPGDRAIVDVSHMGTTAPGSNEIGNAVKLAGEIQDAGSFTATYHFNPATEEVGGCDTQETVTITYPSTTTWAFTGCVIPRGARMPMNDKGTIDIEIVCLSKITITPAA